MGAASTQCAASTHNMIILWMGVTQECVTHVLLSVLLEEVKSSMDSIII